MEDESMELPPGFRFHPTDEEIITHYLSPKVADSSFSARAVGEVDLNKCEPWDLPSKARMGEKEWYFFCQRDRKYPTGTRTNRATEAGYWKATGKDKEIYRGRSPGAVLVGMKKTLVFYGGRAPRGQKTNWVLHEYRLEGKSAPNFPNPAKDEWVVCRVFHKKMGIKIGSPPPATGSETANYYSLTDQDFFDSTTLPPLMDPPPYPNPATTPSSSCFINSSNYDEGFDDSKAFPFPSTADQHAAMNYQLSSHNSSLVLAPPASSYGSFENSGGYLHHERPEAMLKAPAANPNAYNSAIRMRCKMEPSSDQSLGTDLYCGTDISSSMPSKPYEFVDPFPSMDWENLCKY